jgi:hypothetical protein
MRPGLRLARDAGLRLTKTWRKTNIGFRPLVDGFSCLVGSRSRTPTQSSYELVWPSGRSIVRQRQPRILGLLGRPRARPAGRMVLIGGAAVRRGSSTCTRSITARSLNAMAPDLGPAQIYLGVAVPGCAMLTLRVVPE